MYEPVARPVTEYLPSMPVCFCWASPSGLHTCTVTLDNGPVAAFAISIAVGPRVSVSSSFT